MPAKRLFALGVGHVRRRGMPPGGQADQPAEAMEGGDRESQRTQWRVMTAVKREFEPEEIIEDIWTARAAEANVSLEDFPAYRIDKRTGWCWFPRFWSMSNGTRPASA